jgi:hypothetical protein
LENAKISANRVPQLSRCDDLREALQLRHPTAFYNNFGQYEDSAQFTHHLIEALAEEVIGVGDLFEVVVESRDFCRDCGNLTRFTPGFPGKHLIIFFFSVFEF